MTRFDYNYSVEHSYVLGNCKKSAVKDSIEKMFLLNFVDFGNLFSIFVSGITFSFLP